MTRPLALILYQKLLPGSQLVTRLEDLGYRVQTIDKPSVLVEWAQRESPIVVIVDLEPNEAAMCDAIRDLRGTAETGHIPIIAIASAAKPATEQSARTAGATMVVNDQAILLHLNQLLDQALQID